LSISKQIISAHNGDIFAENIINDNKKNYWCSSQYNFEQIIFFKFINIDKNYQISTKK
jgi:signal transduction histidine kinase